jgi:riboflavin kinase/FMN adenylyltransferase
VLGSGTSAGVPSLTCDCAVCTSTDPRDNRLRPSVLLQYNGRNVLIDTTPDFRQQALRANIRSLDAILYTHAHADHIMGLDDVRPFNFRREEPIPVYAAPDTLARIQRAFQYAFRYEGKPAGPIPKLEANVLNGEPFELFGLMVQPIPLPHGRDTTFGYRIANIAYLTDHSEIPEASQRLLHGLDLLFLDALRHRPHITHSTVATSLDMSAHLHPERTVFTHMCHDLGHAETERTLPSNVRLAYDGMVIDTPLRGFRVFRALQDAQPYFSPAGICIGNFDGVHCGHESLFRNLVKLCRERGLKPSVLTFDPHPARILVPDRAPRLLTSLDERIRLMREAGIEQVLVLPFDSELQHLDATQFIERILVPLDTRAVLVGDNFRFGFKLSGSVQTLRELGPKHGFEGINGGSVNYRGQTVSSSAIRGALYDGDVRRAARMLRRPYSIYGAVVHGHGVGSRQTVPTLNLAPVSELPPANGVYVTRATDLDDNRSWAAVTNIGTRPTFENGQEGGSARSIETFLLDEFDGRNPARLRLTFLSRLRDERRFEDPAALRAQILRDAKRAVALHRRLARLVAAREVSPV